jgi:hypothetical protein
VYTLLLFNHWLILIKKLIISTKLTIPLDSCNPSVYFYYKIFVFQNIIETVSNIKTVLQIRTWENNVGIVSFNLSNVSPVFQWWPLNTSLTVFEFCKKNLMKKANTIHNWSQILLLVTKGGIHSIHTVCLFQRERDCYSMPDEQCFEFVNPTLY